MVALSHTNCVERALCISEPYLKPTTCKLDLRHREEAGAARSPTQAPVHHGDPGGVNERARYKLSGLGPTVSMAGGPRVSDYH